MRWAHGYKPALEASDLGQATASNSENKEGYVDQPTVAIFDPEVDGNNGPTNLDMDGVLTKHKQWLAQNAGMEAMQQILVNGILTGVADIKKQEALAEKAATVYEDYSLFVVGKDTPAHLYEKLENLPEDRGVLLTSPRDQYPEGMLDKVEEVFGRDNIFDSQEGAKADAAKKLAKKGAIGAAKLTGKAAVGAVKLAGSAAVGAVKTAGIIAGAATGLA
jgi:hypothetical protein